MIVSMSQRKGFIAVVRYGAVTNSGSPCAGTRGRRFRPTGRDDLRGIDTPDPAA